MKYIYILLFLSAKTFASTRYCEDFYALSSKTDDGKEIKMVVPKSKIIKAGSWSPETGKPPLPITEAYSLAKKWAAKNLTRYDSVAIDSISLKKYRCFSNSMKNPHWYYLIEYAPMIEGNKLYGSGNWLTVLMSGEVLAPIKE